MTRPADTVRIAITSAQALAVAVWLDQPVQVQGPDAALVRKVLRDLLTQVGQKPMPRIGLDDQRAKATALAELYRLIRWSRSAASLPRGVADYLASLGPAALLEQQWVPLEVSERCRVALKGRGRPRLGLAQLRARIAALEARVGSVRYPIDPRELRRLRAKERFLSTPIRHGDPPP